MAWNFSIRHKRDITAPKLENTKNSTCNTAGIFVRTKWAIYVRIRFLSGNEVVQHGAAGCRSEHAVTAPEFEESKKSTCDTAGIFSAQYVSHICQNMLVLIGNYELSHGAARSSSKHTLPLGNLKVRKFVFATQRRYFVRNTWPRYVWSCER